MMNKDRIDPILAGEEVFYRIFHNIFNDEAARKYYGFSQISLFTNSEGHPGWNLWFHNVSGAYQLELLQAENSFKKDRLLSLFEGKAVTKGTIAVRYFPNIDDPILDDFSCLESLLRLGPLFDSTGTPTIKGQSQLNGSSFVVGYLDYTIDIDRTFLELECIAPNRWKDIRVNGLLLENYKGEMCEVVSPGGIDRNLPGWEFAFILFDKMISACCYTNKCLPLTAIVAEKKWIRFDINADNSFLEQLDDEIEIYHLISTFKLTEKDIQLVDKNKYLKTLLRELPKQGFSSNNICEVSKDTGHDRINPRWWEASELKLSHTGESEMQHCCYQDH